MLGRPSLSGRGAVVGASAVAVVGLGLGYAAWAQQPDRLVTQTAARPQAVWTPSSAAPEDTLSHQLEAQRHDSFIELAQAGDIDLVFFGTTEAEMWWWPERGRSVWDRAFGSLKAANFGRQGTQAASLLWRMRNGELDGYQAKLIVLQAGAPGDVGNDRAEFAEGYAALINEIRVRQPQARILLFAPLPRGQNLEAWRQRAQSNAAVFAEFVDDETVFIHRHRRTLLPSRRFLQSRNVVARLRESRNTDGRLRDLGGRASALAGSVRSLTQTVNAARCRVFFSERAEQHELVVAVGKPCPHLQSQRE